MNFFSILFTVFSLFFFFIPFSSFLFFIKKTPAKKSTYSSKFSGTNIGTTILLSRVILSWQSLHTANGSSSISDRTFWATVYSMALGVNYGAFSAAVSASLAGLLWRDILAKKHIHIRRLDFARVNLPIIAIAMTVGCAVLIGEVYIVRTNEPHRMRS